MGKPINDPRSVRLRIKIQAAGYKKLVALAGSVVTAMTAAVATFATPLPALADLTTAQTELRAAMAQSNFKRGRGTKTEQLNTQAKAAILRDLLLQELQYATLTVLQASTDTRTQATLFASSGFGIKNPRKNTFQISQFARGVKQLNTKVHNPGAHILKWKKPTGLLLGKKIDAYNIYIKDPVALVPTYILIATTTATRFTAPPPSLTHPYPLDVWIEPFNRAGAGTRFMATIK